MITQRMKAITWWNTISIRDKESWTRLMMPEYRRFDSLTGREIEEIYKVHLMELQEVALQYFLDELNDFEAGQQDIVVDSFIAGCEYILNKK